MQISIKLPAISVITQVSFPWRISLWQMHMSTFVTGGNGFLSGEWMCSSDRGKLDRKNQNCKIPLIYRSGIVLVAEQEH